MASDSTEKSQRYMANDSSESGPKRVLVVDDEKNIRLTLRRALEEVGIEVTTAATAREAIHRLKDNSCNLVLLDLKLPDIEGFTLLEAIRERWPYLPIIVFSAHGSAEMAAEAVKRGADEFILKPFTPGEIRGVIQRVYSSKSTRLRGVSAKDAHSSAPTDVYRVVVPLHDVKGAEQILWFAAAAARRHEAGELVVVFVIEAPYQTPLEAFADLNHESSINQRLALELAQVRAMELGIDIRTRGIIGHERETVLRNVIREEKADAVFVEWRNPSQKKNKQHASTVRFLLDKSPCEVTLVKIDHREIRDIVVLVSEGPHTVAAAHRAFEFAQSAGVATLTLLNFQAGKSEQHDLEAQGHTLIARVAQKAGLPEDKYKSRVVVTDRLEERLLREATAYDTICLGASRSTRLARAFFGSIPQIVRTNVTANVAIVRGAQHESRTLFDEITEWISDKG